MPIAPATEVRSELKAAALLPGKMLDIPADKGKGFGALQLLGFPLVRYIDIHDSEKVLRAIHTTDPNVPLDIILHTPGGLVLAAIQIARAYAMTTTGRVFDRLTRAEWTSSSSLQNERGRIQVLRVRLL